MSNAGRKRLVLVVEPDDLIRQLVGVWLVDAGYTVELHSTLEQAAQVTADLVIVNLPQSSSSQASADEFVRRQGAPVIAVSARFRRGLGASAAAARRLGVRRVLPKPFTREELLEVVAHSLEEER